MLGGRRLARRYEASRERRRGTYPTYCPAWYPALIQIDAPERQNLRIRIDEMPEGIIETPQD